MKKLKMIAAVFLIICSVMLLVACFGGGEEEEKEPPVTDNENGGNTEDNGAASGENGGGAPSGESTGTGGESNNDGTGDDESGEDKDTSVPGLKKFSGITFTDKTVDYDGNEHEILLGGETLPEGATVNYSNNKGTNAGAYKASVTVTCDGYETKTLNATLTVKKIQIQGVTLSGESFDYDTTKKALTVKGNIPSGVTVSYSGGEDGKNGATNAGEYNIKAILSGDNYITLDLNATLTVKKIQIQGVTLSGESFDYDTTKKTLTVTGNIPSGVTVSYSGGEDGKNGATNAGEYNIKAILSGDNYITLDLNATLTVKKIQIQGVTLSGESFDYDTTKKTLTVTGNIPSGVTVSYSGGEDGKNGATNVGKYTITATLSGANYQTLVLNAELKISSEEELLTVVYIGNKIYFQNSLDKNKLYCYSDGNLEKVNDDVANSMISFNGDI